MVALGAAHSGTSHQAHTGHHDGGIGEAIHFGNSVKLNHPGAHHAGNHSVKMHQSQGRTLRPWFMLSPIDVFSMCLGAGAVGVLAQNIASGYLLAAMAICGALLFNLGVVKPLIGFLLRFASKPAENLEGQIAKEAEAITGFDANGQGLIRLTLDGEYVQLLATLDSLELERGAKVRRGDKLIVVDVDTRKNSCRVIREME